MRNGRGYRTQGVKRIVFFPNIISADVGFDKRMEAANPAMPMAMQGSTTFHHLDQSSCVSTAPPTEKPYRAPLLGTCALAFDLAFLGMNQQKPRPSEWPGLFFGAPDAPLFLRGDARF